MISFRAPAISHIPHSGKNKQQPWLHLISVSLQITHPGDIQAIRKERNTTPCTWLVLSSPTAVVLLASEIRTQQKGRNSLVLSKPGSGTRKVSPCWQSGVLKDSVWAEDSRLWLLIGSGEKPSPIMGKTVKAGETQSSKHWLATECNYLQDLKKIK